MSGNKIGKFICLRKMSSLESFHWCYFMKLLHTTHAANALRFVWSCWKKIAFKKKANRGSIFAC